jgi:small subunit ribosomal protein S17
MPAKTSAKIAAKPSSKPTGKALAQGDLKGTKIGVVESSKRDKTRTVVIAFQAKHPKYGKYIGARTVLQVHDEANQAKTGDVVEVAACRPISKSKSWRLVRVVESRSAQAAALASAKELS